MQRYAVLDGLRGYFLVFMLINHLAFAGGSLLARINRSELGFVQDAQGFVFISGMIVGLYTFVAMASLALAALVHHRWTARARPALRPAVAARPPRRPRATSRRCAAEGKIPPTTAHPAQAGTQRGTEARDRVPACAGMGGKRA